MNQKFLSIMNKFEKIEQLAYELTSLSKTLKRAFENSEENNEDCSYLQFIIKSINKKSNILQDKLEAHHQKMAEYYASNEI